MSEIVVALKQTGLPFREYGVTAVDAYRGGPGRMQLGFYLVQGTIVDLARAFEDLSFPSLPYADAAIQGLDGEQGARFLCVDDIGKSGIGALPLTDFRRSPVDGKYFDPREVYQSLREGKFEKVWTEGENALFETAVYRHFRGAAAVFVFSC